jgi:hypothetical protein
MIQALLMDELTLPKQARKLEKYIMTLPSAKKFNTLNSEPRKAMMHLSDSAYNARIAVEKYFHTDDSEEQAMFLSAAIEYVTATNEAILAASQFDLLGPADVAHLSALAEHIKDRLV